MKKIITLVLAAVMALSVTACGNKDKKNSLVEGNAIGGADGTTDIVVTDEQKSDDKSGASEDKKSDKSKSADKNNDQSADKSTKSESGSKDSSSASISSGSSSSNSSNGNTEAQEKVTPTFKYFVSKSDKGYDGTMKVIDSLKSKYGERVNFDIVDVDENPDSLNNFPMVSGNTPYLIMLNTSNDICGLKPQIKDEKELTQEIENALK